MLTLTPRCAHFFEKGTPSLPLWLVSSSTIQLWICCAHRLGWPIRLSKTVCWMHLKTEPHAQVLHQQLREAGFRNHSPILPNLRRFALSLLLLSPSILHLWPIPCRQQQSLKMIRRITGMVIMAHRVIKRIQPRQGRSNPFQISGKAHKVLQLRPQIAFPTLLATL